MNLVLRFEWHTFSLITFCNDKVFFSNHYKNFEHKFKTMLLLSWLWTYTHHMFHSGELYKMIQLENILPNSGWVGTLKYATRNGNHIGSLMRYNPLLKWGLANILKRK